MSTQIFGSQVFLFGGVPLLAISMSVFLKYVSRNDKHRSFSKEDLAIWMDISTTALVLFASHAFQIAQQLQNSDNRDDERLESQSDKLLDVPWGIAFFVICIWVLSTVVRKKGWIQSGKLHGVWGIAVPNVIAILMLIFVIIWISSV